ncbi:MAG TPA: TniQ family protein [Ramlibacter sp.]
MAHMAHTQLLTGFDNVELMPDELWSGGIGRFVILNNRVSADTVFRLVRRALNRPRLNFLSLAAGLLGLEVTALISLHSLYPWLYCRPAAPLESLTVDIHSCGRSGKLLRVCEKCIAEDLAMWGFAYWRRSHQLLGVTWCTKHGDDLIEVSGLATQDSPDSALTHSHPSSRRLAPTSLQRRYAAIAFGILERGNADIALDFSSLKCRLREVYSSRTWDSINREIREVPEEWINGESVHALRPIINTNGRPLSDGPTLTLALALSYETAGEALSSLNEPVQNSQGANFAIPCA